MTVGRFSSGVIAKLTFALGLILFGLSVVNYFSFYPIALSVAEEESFGAPFLADTGNGIALVVDTTTIRAAGESGRFSQTDWSYGWINLLLQEARNYDVVDLSELNTEEIATRRVWIFTRSALAGASERELGVFLDRIAKKSSDREVTVYLEAPDALAAKSDLLVSLLGENFEARRYSRFTKLDVSARLDRSAPPEFALACDGLELETAPAGFQSLIEFNDTPALWQGRRNGLRLLVSVFNFGQLAVTIQQGRPNDDFSVSPRITKKTGMLPIVSSDLCADSSYYHTFVPFFDHFERGLFAIINGPSAGRQLFEKSSRGAFIMSHDEEGIGDKAAWMAQQEERWGVTSATLVTPAAITGKGIGAMLEAGGEVALHADQYSYFQRPGLPGLRPVRKKYSFGAQRRTLESRFSAASASSEASSIYPVTINRNHWLLWSENYTGMFRKFAGAGLELDLTYGPIGEGIAGYLFGTCFPFVPIDTNGFPLSILELPFLFQDDEEFSAEYLDSIFDTAKFQNEIVNVVFHSNTMGHAPDTLLMWGWRESFVRAKDVKLPIVHYNDVLKALRAQNATRPLRISR